MALLLFTFMMGWGGFAYSQPIFNSEDPQQQQQLQQLAYDEIWLNQLQYEPTLAGGWQSDAAEAAFFLARDGRVNPESELRANLEVFLKDPELPWGYARQPIVCAFPTRKKFLEQNLKIKLKNVPCPDYEKWKQSFVGSKLVLIFSDAFPNNPASMFGHTFLLFSKHEPFDSAEGLMDYAVNFSADTSPEDEKSIWYSIKGLLGGYSARYQISPFYVMANQYSGWDSRDLWYMPLNFTESEVERVVEHIWESYTTTSFGYYFFTKNCSYRILTALDYGRPGMQLHQKFNFRWPTYYVTPISTYKEVTDHLGDSDNEYYTPSIRKRFINRLKSLDQSKLYRYQQIIRHPEQVQDEIDVEVVDTVLAFYDYKKKTASADYLPEEIIQRFRQVALRRASMGATSKAIPYAKKEFSPNLSHKNIVGQIHVDSQYSGMLLGIRPGYHDLLSPDDGYIPWSHLEFFNLLMQMQPEKTRVLDLTAVNLTSFFPIESFEWKPSWRAEGGWNFEKKYYLKAGVGLSWEWMDQSLLSYVFVNPELIEEQKFSVASSRYVTSLEAGLIKKWGRAKAWISMLNYLREPEWKIRTDATEVQLQASLYLRKNQELRFSVVNELSMNSDLYIYNEKRYRLGASYWFSF